MRIKRWFLNNSLKNYQYLLHDNSNAIAIDPLKFQIYMDFIDEQELNLSAILITHKHGDHIAGVKKLIKKYPKAKIYAYEDNDLFQPDVYVKDGDCIDLGFTSFKALHTPGHIADHITFLFEKEKSIFCGDVLFNGGVGGVVDPSANIAELYSSIAKITQLDDDIKPHPAHDYWQNNLDFALSILPDDADFKHYRNNVAETPSEDKPIITLAEESKLNIFIRAFSDERLSQAMPNYKLGQEMFTKLRELKNNF